MPLSRSNSTSSLNQKVECIADIASKCKTNINKLKHDTDNELRKTYENHLKEIHRLLSKVERQTAKNASEYDSVEMHITRTQESAGRYKEQAGNLKEQINGCFAAIPDPKAIAETVSAAIAEQTAQLQQDLQIEGNLRSQFVSLAMVPTHSDPSTAADHPEWSPAIEHQHKSLKQQVPDRSVHIDAH